MLKVRSERAIIFLIAAVQFINILDFVIVMPLGPDFAVALGIPASKLGFIGGSYTAAASVSGLAGAFFLDRFDRRSALAVSMLGLVVGTAAGGLATGLPSLMAARMLAGAFGGPATSVSFSIVADVIPPERRGKAMGTVMGAFSVASVFGIPAGLELARLGGWHLPFFAVAALGLVVAGLGTFLLPPLRGHLAGAAADDIGGALRELREIVSRPLVQISYVATAVVMMAAFVVVPNISAYVQHNLHYPREHLGRLYLIGGIASFVAVRFVGSLVDRIGAFRTGLIGAVLLTGTLYYGFYAYLPGLPVVAIYVMFMTAMTFRNVAHSTLTSRVPFPSERARFTSVQSAVQHLAAAVAAFLSAQMLHELPDLRLEGMPDVAALSIALTILVPPLFWVIEARVAAAPIEGSAE